jgi:hypothetical protein
MMGWLPKNHLPKRGLFAYVSLTKALIEIYVPFVGATYARNERTRDVVGLAKGVCSWQSMRSDIRWSVPSNSS